MKLVKFTSVNSDGEGDHSLWVNPDEVLMVDVDYYGGSETRIVLGGHASLEVWVKEDLITVVKTLTESSSFK